MKTLLSTLTTVIAFGMLAIVLVPLTAHGEGSQGQPDTEMFYGTYNCYAYTSGSNAGNKNSSFNIQVSTLHNMGYYNTYCNGYGAVQSSSCTADRGAVLGHLDNTGGKCTYKTRENTQSTFTNFAATISCRGSRANMINLSADICDQVVSED